MKYLVVLVLLIVTSCTQYEDRNKGECIEMIGNSEVAVIVEYKGWSDNRGRAYVVRKRDRSLATVYEFEFIFTECKRRTR